VQWAKAGDGSAVVIVCVHMQQHKCPILRASELWEGSTADSRPGFEVTSVGCSRCQQCRPYCSTTRLYGTE
jgi:hypothetical protein